MTTFTERFLAMHEVREHDSKTCIRCRIGTVITELFPAGVPEENARDILFAMAEVCGHILAQMPMEELNLFWKFTAGWREATLLRKAKPASNVKH